MKTDSILQELDSFQPQENSTIVKQFCWFMIWPLLTVLLVVGVVYLDRMYTFRAQTVQQENLRLESLQLFFQDRNRTISSDLQFLGNSQLVQSYLSELPSTATGLVEELFDSFLHGREFYKNVRLLNRNGKELITKVSTSLPAKSDSNAFDPLEQPSFFETLSRKPAERIYLFSTPRVNPDKEYQAIKEGSGLRFYCLVRGNDGEPSGFISLDYDRTELFNALNHRGQEPGRRIILLDRGTIWGVSRRTGQESVHGGPSGSEGQNKPGEDLSAHLQETLFTRVAYQPGGFFFRDGALFVYRSINPLPPIVSEVHLDDGNRVQVHENDEPNHWFLVSEVPGTYFDSQRVYYLKFLAVLGVTLLIPSLVVCLFLAKTRARVRLEAALRYREHNDHLEQLEAKVRQRTREVDESNLKLSAEIAERLAAESQLRLNNELLSGMIGSIDGIIYVADFDSHEILFANEYLKRLFGFDPVGRLCWQFLHANQEGPCTFCTNGRLLDRDGKPTPPLQWEYQNPYNKKWYIAKDQAILWTTGKYVRLEIAIDITEQKRLQHFLQEARKQAELATGVRSRFVALVAHDLKSPFFSITQMLKRILDRETFTYRVHREFLENIVKNGHRMLQMIDNLLSMDRFETGEMKLDKRFFDVSAMAEEVIQNFKHPALEKNLTLINEIPPKTSLFADKYLYYVVLNNLLSNAVKFSELNGRIVLAAADDPKHSATIIVEDNGKGMSLEYAQDLFKADIKTSSQGTFGEQGSGLGLIFCQDILKAHHGRILVESRRNVGTRFFVELPQCSSIETNPVQ